MLKNLKILKELSKGECCLGFRGTIMSAYEIFKNKVMSNNNCNNIVQLLLRLNKKINELYPSSHYFIKHVYC